MLLPGLPAFVALLLLTTAQPPQQPQPPKANRYEDLPPAVRLGLRVDAIQKGWAVAPVVVIVPDGASYTAAIGKWVPPGTDSPGRRFPVLIDDGSAAALEDIARFVRGFAPLNIVRWKGGDPLPQEAPARRAMIERTLCRAWGAAEPGENPAAAGLKALIDSHAPRTGIVIASDNDPAWTAALALAAGRAQPLAWVDRPPPGRVDTVITAADLRKFESEIEKACEATHLAWTRIGDDIDTITLCMAAPNRVQSDPKLVLALTDCVGRPPGDDKEQVGSQERWAWAGHIFGTESNSAYMAMCSLFLAPKRAWLFDGYPRNPPWSEFDATGAAEPFKKAGLEVVLDDAPHGGERDWRNRAAKAIEAGLIVVNTKGLSNEFNLEPGRCIPADVPILNAPAMVYLVHSWSAFSPTERFTVGGRWMERGAYNYMGSVDEPFLSAFIPTPAIAGRLSVNAPFAAAVHKDDGKAWKLAVIGDPLTTLLNSSPRTDAHVPFEDAKSLHAELQDALAAKEYPTIIRTLILQGRDVEAAAVARGLLKDDPKSLTPAVAEAAILPLFRAGEHETMMAVFATLPSSGAANPVLRDAIWLAAYRLLPTTRDAKVVSAVRTAIREECRVRDALDLAEPVQRVFGHDAAVGLIQLTRSECKDPAEKLRLEQELRRLNSFER